MHWIDAQDLETWANHPDAASRLPWVIRMLIGATVDRRELVDIPSGSSVWLAGWDGRVETKSGNEFVPSGVSLWEFSCSSDRTGKASGNYEKRTEDPLGADRSKSTFVFVTPRVWRSKRRWADRRRAEGKWRDVRAYDADDLAQWIGTAPSIGAIVATLVEKLPDAGIMSAEEYWEDWSLATDPPLTPELVLAGRPSVVEALSTWATSEPSPFYVQADTRREATVALIASAIKESDTWGDQLLARCLVVRTEDAWRALARHYTPMVLVPNFRGECSPAVAVRQGHHVALPVASDEKVSGSGIALPSLGRDEFTNALTEMGLSESAARLLARKTARRLPVLQRRLIANAGGPKPDWAAPPYARALVPALLVGQWLGSNESDRGIVERIASRPYNEIERTFHELAVLPDAPLRKIGEAWRLTSHEESWELIAPLVSSTDLQRFREEIVRALKQASPAFEMAAPERYLASIEGRTLPQSGLLREGVCRTLALMGTRPEPAERGGDTRIVADAVVREILDAGEDWKLWATLSSKLPVVAEASPHVLLDTVERLVSNTPEVFQELFRQEGDPGFGGCPHAGLLWALECLAWSPEYFSRCCLILAELASVDPGGRYGNRPRESLRQLFLSWIRYSEVDDGERLAVLDVILDRHPEVGWQLLVDVGPEEATSATPHNPPEWREWGQDTRQAPTGPEWIEFAKAVAERLARHVDEVPGRWTPLLRGFSSIPRPQRERTREKLEQVVRNRMHPDQGIEIWDGLRDLLHHHRSFPDAAWALPEAELYELELVYRELTPKDHVLAYRWLFANWPRSPDGERPTMVQIDEKFSDKRRRAVEEVKHALGEPGIARLARSVESPWTVGQALAETSNDLADLSGLAVSYLAHAERSLHACGAGVCNTVYAHSGWRGIDGVVESAKARRVTAMTVASIFQSLPPSSEVWQRVEREGPEVDRWYWRAYNAAYPFRRSEAAEVAYAAEKLLAVGRANAGVYLLSHSRANVDSSIIVRTLSAVPMEAQREGEDVESPGLDLHGVSELLERLEQQEDVSIAEVARLEVPFVGAIERLRPRLALHRWTVERPELFADLVAWGFKRSDGRPDIGDELDETQRRLRAKHAFRLLVRLTTLPGARNGCVHAEELHGWVREARRLCSERGRKDIGDVWIGQILANAPSGEDGAWPHEEVRNVLEEHRSDAMARGFETGKLNLRGVTTRSPFAGGDQERGLSAAYNRDADRISARWPFTAGRLRSLARNYEHEARRWDEDAWWRDESQ